MFLIVGYYKNYNGNCVYNRVNGKTNVTILLMTQIKVILVFIFLGMVSNSCGQTYHDNTNMSYSINPSIKTKINSKVQSSNEVVWTSMDIKEFENDSVTWNTYANGKSLDECMTLSSLDNDTINILSFFGFSAAFGYQITITKDICLVTYFTKSDSEIYKLKKSDPLHFGISVPCSSYRLTLVSKPTFKKGEVIEGIIELTSDEYFEVSNGIEIKYQTELTGYFKTNKLKSRESR